jgi:hypothetical protein
MKMFTLWTNDAATTDRLAELFLDPSFRLSYFGGELDRAIDYAESRSVALEENWAHPPGVVQ